MSDRTKDLMLAENEIRSVIRGELKRALDESAGGLELSFVVGDAMLDGLRSVVVAASRNPDVQKSIKSIGPADPRQTAEKIVNSLLTRDSDFKTDLVSLVAAMVKRASG